MKPICLCANLETNFKNESSDVMKFYLSEIGVSLLVYILIFAAISSDIRCVSRTWVSSFVIRKQGIGDSIMWKLCSFAQIYSQCKKSWNRKKQPPPQERLCMAFHFIFSSILNECLQLKPLPWRNAPSLTCWGLTSVYFSSQQVHWLTVPKAGVPILLFCAYLIFPGALSGPNGLPVLASSLLTRVWVTVSDDGPITKLHGFWGLCPLPYFFPP